MSVSLEEKLNRLEEIVGALDDGGLTLEESLNLYSEGVGLSEACRKEIDSAGQIVEKGLESLKGLKRP